jgi:hypothetical protein
VWFAILLPLEIGGATPHNNKHFTNWWAKTTCKVKKESRKGTNSLTILTALLIWKYRVFDGITSSVNEVLRQFRDEYQLLGLAGAKNHEDLKLHGIGAFI